LILTAFSFCTKKEKPVEYRSFYMGVTPWPADFTVEEVQTAYRFIDQHCDIASQHIDDGIPYEEFYSTLPLPLDFENDINYRVNNTPAGKKIFLSVSALNLTRKEKADYYGKSIVADSIKTRWKNLPVNDPKVISAYINYMNWLINKFKPIYVNYGVESNVLLWDPTKFSLYKDFISKVYAQLKADHPSLVFFVSFMVDESNEGLNNARQLLPYSDWIGLSSYPYITVSSSIAGNTDPANFPTNYYERFITLDPAKPFAFAETGYLAENLVVPSEGLNKQGNENWQADYLEKVLSLSNKYNAKLFIWFCSKDYDAGNNTLRNLGLYQNLFSFWEDTGLIDENGRERPGLKKWDQWLSKQKR
jgi:hypothetical protein